MSVDLPEWFDRAVFDSWGAGNRLHLRIRGSRPFRHAFGTVGDLYRATDDELLYDEREGRPRHRRFGATQAGVCLLRQDLADTLAAGDPRLRPENPPAVLLARVGAARAVRDLAQEKLNKLLDEGRRLGYSADKFADHVVRDRPVVTGVRDPLLSLGTLAISRRTLNALEGEGIRTLGDLAQVTERQFLRIPNIGSKGLADLRAAVSEVTS